MDNISQNIYRFDKFRLDADERLLFDGDKPISLTPKVFDTLLFLLENTGKVISKERMMDEIWEGSFVEENNLAQNISYLRRILGETKVKKFIETVPKFGYRFVASVQEADDLITTEIFEKTNARVFVRDVLEEVEESGSWGIEELGSKGVGEKGNYREISSTPPLLYSSTPHLLITKPPETHYVENGDVNIAYQVVGDGDFDIVFVMGWVSHLEYFWKHHLFASFLNRLASFSRLILFDKRGTGLSDRVPLNQLPTLEQRMEDVHAVMDAVDSEKAVLIGVSEGGPMCSLFAATYPERTKALVMFGTYAKRIKDEDYPWGVSTTDREEFFEMMRKDWGKPVGIEERAPTLADDEEFSNWWAEYLRMGASPGAAVALTKMNAEIDVRNVLPSVQVPTLVMHRTGDLCLKVEEGRYVAEKIPDSKFVELEGIDHLPFVGNQDEVLDEIEEFLMNIQHADEFNRVLATVINIKITDPTAEAEVRGHEDWENLLENSRVYVQRQLNLFKGKEISFDANGVLATFDGPARAIRCATAITNSAQRLGIRVKTGLHTGECEIHDGIYSGLAVELAKQIADQSDFGKILVSRTVKDLVAGSGINFQEAEQKTFANIEGNWRLFFVEN